MNYIVLKKWLDGKYSVSRLIYEMNDGNRQYYLAKKQHAEEARAAYLERIAAEA